ncbi:MAG: tripartite tricarboxylate transporter permease [Phascolarctobacterium sp.]|nr:tripartite tricarboxylate transporter permease [Phascolarctobacterium sp.]
MADILSALNMIFVPLNLLGLAFGVAVGIAFGCMPGLSVNMGLALLFPLAFSFQGIGGILMLLGIYCGAIYGGSISAILLKTPGTPASVATTLDGYPMATKLKQPGRALGISTMASTFGGVFSTICLILLAPQLAKVALQFSKPEYFALAIFGLSIITSVSSGSVVKGIMGGLFGLFLATVGIDDMSGSIRFTMDTTYFLGGVSFIPVLIGVFAFAQVLSSIEDYYHSEQAEPIKFVDKVLPSWADFKKVFVTLVRSSTIGTFIGCVPGTGGDIASFVSYDQAKRWSKNSSNFGNGEPEGVAAPEAGNNAVSGGAFIPVLTLGIPGDGATAIMMGALMVQGLQPGPLLFVEKAPDVYAIFIGLLLANLIMGIMGFSLIRLFAKVVNVPVHILLPIIVMMTFVGTYSYNNSMNDVYLMVASGFTGYFLNKLGFSMSAIIIGIILGSMAEQNFVGSLIMSDGNFNIFFSRPICLFFLVAAALSLLSPVLGKLFKKG